MIFFARSTSTYLAANSFLTSTPSSSLCRSRTCPKELRTTKSESRKRLIVFSFVGDSTMTRSFVPALAALDFFSAAGLGASTGATLGVSSATAFTVFLAIIDIYNIIFYPYKAKARGDKATFLTIADMGTWLQKPEGTAIGKLGWPG